MQSASGRGSQKERDFGEESLVGGVADQAIVNMCIYLKILLRKVEFLGALFGSVIDSFEVGVACLCTILMNTVQALWLWSEW